MKDKQLEAVNQDTLHAVLLRACPPDENGHTSIARLAEALDTSYQNLYKCISNDRLPTAHKLPKRIIEVSEGRVTQEDLMPFLNVL